MPGRGPAPKDPAQRRRRNKPDTPTKELAQDDEIRGPELPDSIPWPEPTRKWWDTWRMSPQSQTMTETDWDFLLDTALLHARFWEGDVKVAAELRLRVAKFGATKEDRLRLKEQVGQPDVKPDQKADGKGESRYGHLRVAAGE